MQVTTNAVDTHLHDMMRGRIAAAIASLLAALAASSCCLLPLVLFTLGVGGAWIGNLVRLAPLQPYFIAVAAVSLGTGYWLVHRSRIACAGHGTCGAPIANRLVTSILVAATGLVALAIAFKFLATLLSS